MDELKFCAWGEARLSPDNGEVELLLLMPGKRWLGDELTGGDLKTYFKRCLSLETPSFLQASCRTSVRYVPGVTLTVVRRRSLAMTVTCDAMVERVNELTDVRNPD